MNAIHVAVGMAFLTWTVAEVRAAEYEVDPVHSTVAFAIRHLGIADTRGVFTNFTGTVSHDPATPGAFKARGTVAVAGIDTRNRMRDEHLLAAEFFDAAQHPEIRFETTGARREGAEWIVTGRFTMRGVTKEITLRGEIAGPIVDPMGKSRIGLRATTKINRRDYGMTWSKNLDKGGAMIGDEVTISLDIEAVAP